MQFFSKQTPNLINDTIKKQVHKIIKKKTISKYTISEKISHLMSYMYEHCIQKNLGLVIIITIITLFLIYRYYNKSPRSERYTSIVDDITSTITKHLKYDTQPSFDSLKSVSEQKEKVNYPPEPLPINLDGTVTLQKDLYPTQEFPILNTPNYNYNNVYEYPSRNYYTGVYNPYQNAQDTNIVNPLGYPNDFNSKTGEFVGQMTDYNKQNMINYQNIIDQQDQNLKTGLLHEGQYIRYDDPCLNIKPPYLE